MGHIDGTRRGHAPRIALDAAQLLGFDQTAASAPDGAMISTGKPPPAPSTGGPVAVGGGAMVATPKPSAGSPEPESPGRPGGGAMVATPKPSSASGGSSGSASR